MVFGYKVFTPYTISRNFTQEYYFVRLYLSLLKFSCSLLNSNETVKTGKYSVYGINYTLCFTRIDFEQICFLNGIVCENLHSLMNLS